MIPLPFKLKLSKNQKFSGTVIRGQFATYVIRLAESPQWAIQVSKRIDKRAVSRNRLRRQINNWLYRHRQLLSNQQFLVIIKSNPQSNLEDFFNELAGVLKIQP